MSIDPAYVLRPTRLQITPIEDMSPEPSLPLDAATLRSHCHTLISDDSMLEFYQRAAIEWLERDTGKTIVARQHRLALYDFPRTGEFKIFLPQGKTQSVDKIEYIASGTTITLYGPSSNLSPASSDYQEDLTGDDGGVIYPIQGSSWPTPDFDAVAPVIIAFTAGFEEGSVPFDVKESLAFCVSTLFENRGASDLIVGGTVNPRMFEVMSLLIQTRRTHPFA